MWSWQAGGELGPTGPPWMAAAQVSDVDLALVAMPCGRGHPSGLSPEEVHLVYHQGRLRGQPV